MESCYQSLSASPHDRCHTWLSNLGAVVMCPVLLVSLSVLCFSTRSFCQTTEADVEVFQKIGLPPVLTYKNVRNADVDLLPGPLGTSRTSKYTRTWRPPSKLFRPGQASMASTWFDRSFPGSEVPTWGEFYINNAINISCYAFI